jgi:hypothetical protein
MVISGRFMAKGERYMSFGYAPFYPYFYPPPVYGSYGSSFAFAFFVVLLILLLIIGGGYYYYNFYRR